MTTSPRQPNDGVAKVHIDLDYAREDYILLRDAFEGERAMKERASSYIIALDSQTNDANAFAAYVQRGEYLPVVSQTVEALRGLAFRKQPVISAPDDSAIAEWLKRVDGDRQTVVDLARKLLTERLLMGRAALFLDFPTADEIDEDDDLSVAEAMEKGFSPLLSVVPTESIVNWVEKSGRLVYVAIHERVTEFDHLTMDEEVEEHIRVLKLDADGVYVQQIWVAEGAETDTQLGGKHNRKFNGTSIGGATGYALKTEIVPTLNGEPLDYIPIYFATEGGYPDVAKSPMLDLARKARDYFRKSCEINHAEHLVMLPTPYAIGFSESELEELDEIGPGTRWSSTNEGAKVGFLESDGTGIGVVHKSLDRIEKQLSSLGARILAPASDLAPESGIALSIRAAGENASLTDAVQDIERVIKQVLRIVEQFYELAPGSVSFKMNRDFVSSRLGANEVKALHDMLIAGSISYETFIANLKAGEIVDQDVSADDERERIENDGAGLGAGFGE